MRICGSAFLSVGKSISQMARLRVSRSYASLSPRRETAGQDPFSLICTAGALVSAETLHSADFPPRAHAKITEWPSADHLGDPRSLAGSVVIRIGSPPAAGIVMISSGNPVSLLRANRICFPSREKDGPQSCVKGGGVVSRRTTELSKLNTERLAPPLKASIFPSGDQSSAPTFGAAPGTSNRRSLPPPACTT